MRSNYSVEEILDRIQYFMFAVVGYGIVVGYLLGRGLILWVFVVIAIFVVGMLRFGSRWVDTSKAHMVGRVSEIKVDGVLSLLDKDEYCHVNDVVIEEIGANIDHVVIGKSGVWLIETKNWSSNTLREYPGKLNYVMDELPKRAKKLQIYLVDRGLQVRRIQAVLVMVGNTKLPDIQKAHLEIVDLPGLLQLISTSSGQEAIDPPLSRKIYTELTKNSKSN